MGKSLLLAELNVNQRSVLRKIETDYMKKLTIVGTIRFENTPISDFRVYFDLTHFLAVNNGRLDIVNEFQPLCTIILKRVALVLVRC